MKSFISLLILTLTLMVDARAENFQCQQQYLDGKAPVIHVAAFKNQTRTLCYSEFSVVHSGVTRTPLWSSQFLTKAELDQPKIARVDNFHEELAIPTNERATLNDYKGSGFDRGHLTPNADLPTRQAKDESFSLANIVPQSRANNQVIWEGIERSARGFVKNRSDSYIITGVLFLKGQQRINNRVAIPSHIFKLIYSVRDRKGAAYLVENVPTLDYKIISVKELEELAGINFFPTLSEDVKNSPLSLPSPQISKSNRQKFPELSQSNSSTKPSGHLPSLLAQLLYIAK